MWLPLPMCLVDPQTL